MFVLQNIALINWYLFSAIDIPIGGNVAIIGVNGSGKSSILDAIQTCIMGGDKTYISFNARTEQRAQERTIRDYVLGKNPHGYLRESAYNYIVLGYRRDHDGYEYSIGLAMSASGESHEIETRFAVEGRILKTSDLCNIDGENMSVVRFKELKASLDSAGIPVKTWVQASKFRTGYMADLNPSSKKTGFPGVDDDRFKRIFKHTIEFNVDKIGHISDFVRSFILPTSEMPVEDWRAQHANYKEILDRIKIVERELDATRRVHKSAESLYRASLIVIAKDLARDRQEFRAQNRDFDKKQREISALAPKRERADLGIERSQSNIYGYVGEIANLKSRMQVGPAGENIPEMEQRLLHLKREEAEKVAQLENLREAAKFLKPLIVAAKKAGVAASELALNSANMLHEASFAENWTWEINGKVEFAAMTNFRKSGFREHIENRYESYLADRKLLFDRLKAVDAQLTKASTGHGYPIEVQETLDALARSGIFGTPLSAVVSIKQEYGAWQLAAEMLLGGFCKSILVPPNRVKDSLAAVMKMRSSVTIVRTNRMNGAYKKDDLTSIAWVLNTDNPEAKELIWRQIGRYQRCETIADLDATENGVMLNGMTSSGLGGGKRILPDRRQLFGSDHGALAGELQRSIGAIRREIADLESENGALKDLVEKIRGVFKSFPATEGQFTNIVENAHKAAADALRMERQLQDIRERTDPELNRQIADLEELKKESEAELVSFKEERRLLENETGQLLSDIKGLRAKRTELAQKMRSKRREYIRQHESMEIYALCKEILEVFNGKRPRDSIEFPSDDKIRRLRTEFRVARDDFRIGYNSNDLPIEGSEDLTYIWAQEFVSWSSSKIQRLEENVLRPHREHAEKALEVFLDTTRQKFMQIIRTKISDMKLALSDLNKNLGRRQFNGNIYFISHESVSSKKAMINLADNIEQRSHKFSKAYIEENPNDPDVRTIQELMDYLTGAGSSGAADESAKRIAELVDYRTYYEFDIEIRDAKTKEKLADFTKRVKSASGGERHVPFYVCLAVALGSTYFGKLDAEREGKSGLVLLDEMFNTLDRENIYKIVGYFRSLGLQVIGAGPDTNRAIYTHSMDRVVTVLRRETRVHLNWFTPTDRGRSLIEMADPTRSRPERSPPEGPKHA